jgi:hypothetical protein
MEAINNVRNDLQLKVEALADEAKHPNPKTQEQLAKNKVALEGHLASDAPWLDGHWDGFAKDSPELCAQVKALL